MKYNQASKQFIKVTQMKRVKGNGVVELANAVMFM